MDSLTHHHQHHNYASHRSVGMMLALVTAIVLSPIYLSGENRRHERRFYKSSWWTLSSSGLVLPAVVVGLVIAIKTASTSPSTAIAVAPTPDPERERFLPVESSTLGLAGILLLLIMVISWQGSIQGFFWR